tara:strand:+ start:7293 stop:7619 length:327 start_codon:yes stop_codon:yes gene_type:complete
MKYPKILFIQLPKTEYPVAIPIETSKTPESDKDFEVGELYLPSEKDESKLSPRRDISPSIFNLSRKDRRNHPSNFEHVKNNSIGNSGLRVTRSKTISISKLNPKNLQR